MKLWCWQTTTITLATEQVGCPSLLGLPRVCRPQLAAFPTERFLGASMCDDGIVHCPTATGVLQQGLFRWTRPLKTTALAQKWETEGTTKLIMVCNYCMYIYIYRYRYIYIEIDIHTIYCHTWIVIFPAYHFEPIPMHYCSLQKQPQTSFFSQLCAVGDVLLREGDCSSDDTLVSLDQVPG